MRTPAAALAAPIAPAAVNTRGEGIMAAIDRDTAVHQVTWFEGVASEPTIWLFIRLVLGISWLRAAQDKIGAPGWTAEPAGAAVTGFLKGALAKTAGEHPEVQPWFATLVNDLFLPNAALLAYAVTAGEFIVGAALLAGLLTRWFAAGGALMNFMFLAAGTTSNNPEMLLLQCAIVLFGVSAGTLGLDRWVLPWLARRRLPATMQAAGAAVTFVVALGAPILLAYLGTDGATWLIALTASCVVSLGVSLAVRRS